MHTPKSNARLRLIFTLWGLLFTKCFTLEFLVRQYEVPISSVTYVWTLSILMASVATAVYANLESDERKGLIGGTGFYVYVITALAVTILVARSLLIADINPLLSLAPAAVAMGIGHTWQLMQNPRSTAIWIPLGWFVSAAALAVIGTPANFLVFAISLLILSVVPGFIQVLNYRRQRQ